LPGPGAVAAIFRSLTGCICYNVAMREIEVKILEIDTADVTAKLIALGARKTFDGEIHALYYDTPDSAIRGKETTLRLRKEGGRAVLAVKRDISDERAKVREELEVEVSDFATMKTMFEALGLRVWLEMRKHRISFELSGLHFDFDRYDGEYAYIPEFLEIEGSSLGVIHEYAALLGFSAGDCRPWDAVDIARHYAERRGGPG
jgi:adenylate cyclase, class 2